MWIESHQSLRSHPKVKKAARLAGVSEKEMIGCLHYLWWWALDYAPDGDVTKYSPEDIEAAVDWNGTPYVFYNALVDCGFNGHCGLIEKTGEHVLIHDWDTYAGKLIERREANANRMRSTRAKHVQGTLFASVELPNQPNQPNQPTIPTEPTDQPAAPDGLSDLQHMVLASFNAKRFKNQTQAAVVAAWDRYPEQNVKAACAWAATKGFGLGQAIASIETALPKWGAPKKNGSDRVEPSSPMLRAIARSEGMIK